MHADDEDGFRSPADLVRSHPVYEGMKLESIGVTVRGSDGELHSVQIGLDQGANGLVVGRRWNELAIIERLPAGGDASTRR